MRAKFKIALILVALLAVLAGYVTSTPKQAETQLSSVSWAIDYKSIEEMARGVDLIIVGEVVKATPRPGDLFSMIDFDVKVIQAIKPADFGNISVKVTQMGGPNLKEGRIVEVRDDPPMHIGDRVVLFLLKIEDMPGLFMIPGPWGRYELRDGKVYSLDLLYPNRVRYKLEDGISGTTINGKIMEDFVATVSSYTG